LSPAAFHFLTEAAERVAYVRRLDLGAAAIILMNVATLVFAKAKPTITPSAASPAST
jgi:hypothetical protein